MLHGCAVGLALPPSTQRGHPQNWLIEETLSLFSFHYFPELPAAAQLSIVAHTFPTLPPVVVHSLLQFSDQLRVISAEHATNSAGGSSSGSTSSSAVVARPPPPSAAASSLFLSLRQLLRVGRHAVRYPQPAELGVLLRRTLMSTFLPHTLRASFETALTQFLRVFEATYLQATTGKGSAAPSVSASAHAAASAGGAEQAVSVSEPRVIDGQLTIDNVSYPVVRNPPHPELVPDILFFNISKHVLILKEMVGAGGQLRCDDVG